MTSFEKVLLALKVVEERKALDPVTLDLRTLTLVTDYFVICEGASDVHLRAIADALLEGFAQAGLRPLGTEGYREARWILVDLGDLVIHLFAAEDRAYYALERLWGDAPRVHVAQEEEARR